MPDEIHYLKLNDMMVTAPLASLPRLIGIILETRPEVILKATKDAEGKITLEMVN